MIVFRYIVQRFLVAFVAALVGLCALYLIVDFADRVKIYSVSLAAKVAELYWNKTITVVYQLAPAALGLAGAICMSSLRRTGEVTALRALGRGRMTFALPVALMAAVVGVALFAMEDGVVAPASRRAEDITANVFKRWGDWGAFHFHRKWFRGDGGTVYRLGRHEGTGFADVSVYELDPDTYRMNRRIDAARIVPAHDRCWRVESAVVRTFPADGPMREEHFDAREECFTDDLQMFRVKTGRPSQLRRDELPDEIVLRERLGLPSLEWRLALHERRAYQLAGIPSALFGAALALRPGRRGHLTAAIGEGFGITIFLWGASVIARTLTLGGHLAPVVGGFLPLALASLAAVLAWRSAR